jgi:hypothetical protein
MCRLPQGVFKAVHNPISFLLTSLKSLLKGSVSYAVGFGLSCWKIAVSELKPFSNSTFYAPIIQLPSVKYLLCAKHCSKKLYIYLFNSVTQHSLCHANPSTYEETDRETKAVV